MAKLIEIEGIGPTYAEKLAEQGLKTTEDLLEACAGKKGRADLAEKTGISEARILRWTNMCDLFRIKGVGEQYSDLLEKAGVDTVKELRHRVPANLHKKMEEVNAEHNLVNKLPSLSAVEGWVEFAKGLEPKMTY